MAFGLNKTQKHSPEVKSTEQNKNSRGVVKLQLMLWFMFLKRKKKRKKMLSSYTFSFTFYQLLTLKQVIVSREFCSPLQFQKWKTWSRQPTSTFSNTSWCQGRYILAKLLAEVTLKFFSQHLPSSQHHNVLYSTILNHLQVSTFFTCWTGIWENNSGRQYKLEQGIWIYI